MKHITSRRLILLTFFFLFALGSQATNTPAATSMNDFTINISDVQRFKKLIGQWQSGNQAHNLMLLKTNYLANASVGLADYYDLKITNDEKFVTTVETLLSYYQALEIYTFDPTLLRPQLFQMFNQFSEWTSDAQPLDVYFVIGRMTSAGTVSKNAILVGAEQLVKTAPTDLMAQGYKFITVESLVLLIAHEYVHSFQHQAGPATLIRAAIFEGGADFLAELASGISPISKTHYRYGAANEQQVWHKFTQEMYSTDVSNWLANRQKGNWPGDMGYYVGYQIAKGYYANMSDKREAFRQLTTITDAEHILKISQYASDFQ